MKLGLTGMAMIALLFTQCKDNKPGSEATASQPKETPAVFSEDPYPLGVEKISAAAKEIAANVNSIHVWVDKEQVFLTGIVSNTSTEWQRFWLEATPVSQSGKPIIISKNPSVVVTPYNDAVPPSGRTSFFATWPVSTFSSLPNSFTFKVWGQAQKPGPILAIPMTSAIQASVPQPTGEGLKPEVVWHMTGGLSNPLNLIADHPRIEVLVYGMDNQLWFATVLNTEDKEMRKLFQWDREGPLKPKEERPFNLQVYTIGMPDALKEMGIKKIDLLPFNARM
jgi:hypothetical protein